MNPWNPTPPPLGLGRVDGGAAPEAHATTTRPTFGFGGASIDEPRTAPERPVPSLPPVDASTAEAPVATPRHEPVFRTEISFRRVQLTQQASANGAGQGDTEPSVTHEPVAELPSLEIVDPVDDKVPFYKREISFGRKKDETDTVEVEAVAQESDEKIPFYKRELSFGRKHETDVDDTVVAEQVADPVVEVPVEHVAEVVAPVVVARTVVVDEPVAEKPAAVETAVVEPVVEEPVTETVVEEVEVVAESDTDDARVEDAVEEPELVVEPEVEAEVEPEPEVEADVDPDPVVDTPDEVVAEEPSVDVVPPAATNGRRSVRSTPGSPKPQKARSNGGRGKQRRVIGLKIGASQLAAAVVVEENGAHELLELARTPLDPGIVVDGEVRDADALVAALKAFFSEHKLPTKDVRIGLASSRIGVRTFDIVGIEDESRLDNAVRFKAHEVLPVAVHESVLDYRVLGQSVVESGETSHHVLLVVAPRDQVEPYMDVCSRAGLKLVGIDLEALGVMRAFVEPGAPIRDTGDTATVVVSVGHEHSSLIVAGGSVCEFTRVFDWGGATLEEAIAQELQVSALEAQQILHQVTLAGSPTTLDSDTHARALDAVRLRLTPFARELVSSLQFYQSQPDSLGIGEILITGGASRMDGLAEALHQMIGVSVRVGDPLARMIVRTAFDQDTEEAMPSFAVPIGLAIEDEARRGVNLVPSELRNARKHRSLKPLLVPAAVILPIFALGAMAMQARGDVADRETQLLALQSEYSALPVPTTPEIDPALSGSEAIRAGAVAEVLGSRVAWDGVLRDFAKVLPGNVWLTQLTAKVAKPLSTPIDPTQAAAAASTTPPPPLPTGTATTPSGVTITGYTYTQADVARLLARVATLPTVKNVQLQSSANAMVGKKSVVQFTILADLRESGGAA